MTRKQFWQCAAGMSLAGTELLAQGKGRGKKGSGKRLPRLGFDGATRNIIWDYADTNPGWLSAEVRRMPPGLVKKLQRGKALPPGWRKKIVGFPTPLENRLAPLPGGYRRVIVDRWAFVIANASNIVLDMMDLLRN